jgi:hypothetical protein
MQYSKTDFSQIGYGHLNNSFVPLSSATIGMLMKQIHETSTRTFNSNPTGFAPSEMKKFSKEIGSAYVNMTRGQLSIYDKIVRGTILNGTYNNGLLKKGVGKNSTFIHKVRFGHLMNTMLQRIDYILDNFDSKHESFPFKSDKLRNPFKIFYDELVNFADFLEDKCDEWKNIFTTEVIQIEPTDEPIDEPTDEPIDESTDEPTDESTDEPTDEPIDEPTDEPTIQSE